MTERGEVDVQQALLEQARRQTKAQESIVNILWALIALAVLAAVLVVITVG